MIEEQQRKERVSINLEIFDQVKRLYATKTKQELLENTNLKLQAERLKFVISSNTCLVFVVYSCFILIKYFKIYTNSFLSLLFFNHYFYYLKQYMLQVNLYF